MTRFGYHASHEQHSPRELLEYVQRAERAGFALAMCSDHFHPWIPHQGHSGFAWAWLGAALNATSLTFGCVNAPGWRYHPAIVAQAAATLAVMYPDRFWVALGSGEALNEHITGERWPSKQERNARLAECVQVIRALWSSENVDHHGRITVEDAKLYTRPDRAPLIFGAALTPETAHWVGSWADGMITVGAERKQLETMISAFREGGGRDKPIKVQASLAWAPTEREAREAAHRQWSGNLLGKALLATLRTPEEFEAATRFISVDEVCKAMPVSSDPSAHIEHLRLYRELGIEDVYLFNVTPYQREFIDTFGERVLPHLHADGRS